MRGSDWFYFLVIPGVAGLGLSWLVRRNASSLWRLLAAAAAALTVWLLTGATQATNFRTESVRFALFIVPHYLALFAASSWPALARRWYVMLALALLLPLVCLGPAVSAWLWLGYGV
jgi:hypothetical protein